MVVAKGDRISSVSDKFKKKLYKGSDARKRNFCSLSKLISISYKEQKWESNLLNTIEILSFSLL